MRAERYKMTTHPKWVIKRLSTSKIHAVKIVTWDDHTEICTVPHVYTMPTMGDSEGKKAADLIASAPELLEIVEELGRFITNIENGFQPSTEDTIAAFKFIAPQVRAAIAKAEGN